MKPQAGTCECGCGAPTTLIKYSDRSKGLVAGEYRRFVSGHHRRTGYRAEDRGFVTPCWIWAGRLYPEGYGHAYANGRITTAHRAFYERRYGPVAADLDVDHLCRVRQCVNPDHMEPVTRAVNVRRGAGAKLTAIDVAAIRSFRPHIPHLPIAHLYGITRQYVSQLRRGHGWEEVA